jgi:hypothetical protein
MAKFKLGVNGYVTDQSSEAELTAIFRNLALLRRDSCVDFSVVADGRMAIETLRCARRLTGNNFREWMRVNADGPLKVLIRDLLNYINGKVGHLTMNSSITMHEEMLRNNAHRQNEALYVPSDREGSAIDIHLKNGRNLFDFDLYRLMSGMGAVNVARIFLLLGGASYYG